MAENSYGDEFSVLAVVLVLLAAILIFLEGLALLAIGSAIGSFSPTLGGAVSALGFLGVLLGLILGGMAVVLYRTPAASRIAGIVVMLGSFLSLYTGGGFYLGLVLGIVGGIVAILFEPGDDVGTDLGDL
ncbi:MAG: hypothetical protein WB789_07815 [Thermoplasmata archaeon]